MARWTRRRMNWALHSDSDMFTRCGRRRCQPGFGACGILLESLLSPALFLVYPVGFLSFVLVLFFLSLSLALFKLCSIVLPGIHDLPPYCLSFSSSYPPHLPTCPKQPDALCCYLTRDGPLFDLEYIADAIPTYCPSKHFR